MDKLKIEAFKEKNQMLSNMKSIILSTVDQHGKPNASYAPSVIDENGSFFIYISTLSKHTQNLLNNSKVSMMIIEDETNSENLFARKRFTIKGKSEAIIRDSERWNHKMKLLENKFGESITFLKDLTDFHLFELTPNSGLLVYGFARAFHFTGNDLNTMKHLNEKGHTKEKGLKE